MKSKSFKEGQKASKLSHEKKTRLFAIFKQKLTFKVKQKKKQLELEGSRLESEIRNIEAPLKKEGKLHDSLRSQPVKKH